MRFLLLVGAFGCAGGFLLHESSSAQGPPPVAGFQPMVGFGLTDEFQTLDDDLLFSVADLSLSPGGSYLGGGHFELALLDTGANGSILTASADAGFDLAGEGFRGEKFVTLGGATGTIQARVNNPLGIYAAGVGDRSAGASLDFANNTLVGQTSVSLLTFPASSDLPNVLGLPFAKEFATYIRSDQPQIFTHDGRTVRTPQVDFLDLGAGADQGIVRRAPIELLPGISFAQPAAYIPDFVQIVNGGEAHENPTSHTLLSDGVASVGAMFLSVDIEDNNERLEQFDFFFDTGADVTVVSELNAARLGFDVLLDDPEFTIAVIGSGGAKLDVPGFYVDEFEVETVGGSMVVHNLPVIVLNVTNAGDPGNIVDGIVGTNVFAGRNLVIDPEPSLGGGGSGPQLYISDPVTSERTWSAAASSADWSTGANWGPVGTPDLLTVARVRHAAGGPQEAVIIGSAQAWEVNVDGGEGDITLRIADDGELTTFSGVNIFGNGRMQVDGVLDTQFVELRDGVLTGSGLIRTGNGEIDGQVENNGGVVAPGDGVGVLEIVGRFSNNVTGTIEIEIGGFLSGVEHDRIEVEGVVALEGVLSVSLVDLGNAFSPATGDRFTILHGSDGIGGEFAVLDLPEELTWYVDYQANTVDLVVSHPGDFNSDGVVDSIDYAVWREGLGTTYTQQDFEGWRDNYGATIPLPGDSAHTPVPEPAALLLLATALLCGRRRSEDA